MKTYISVGDFIDFVYKIQVKGWSFFQKKIRFSSASRAKNTWDIDVLPPTNWWIIPAINKRWNYKITGDENIPYYEYVASRFLKGKEHLSMLVPACGTGSHERRFLNTGKISHITGFDISPICIKEAQKESKKTPDIQFDYQIANADSFEFEEKKYDIVLFHSSLHHIDKMDGFLVKIKDCLKDDGIIILHDYVGPRRLHWTKEQLYAANQALHCIPNRFRTKWKVNTIKKKVFRPGWWRMYLSDPSEAVESDAIIPTLHKYFQIIEEKKIGGDLLHLLLKDIAHHFVLENNEINGVLCQLFALEDDYLKNKGQSDFMFAIYKKVAL